VFVNEFVTLQALQNKECNVTMAKPSKIEVFGCQEIVWAGVRNEKPVRKIAEECSEWAGENISHTAIAKYIKEKGSA
jgi:hypothetical protein